MDRIKIRFNGCHYCYLNRKLCLKFLETTECSSLKEWIKSETEQHFHVSPNSRANISKIQNLLNEMYYDTPGEWIQELMRNKTKES